MMIEVAVLWLVNENGELLLAQRALHKRQDPGVWGPSVTGKLEPGENAMQALLRETQEELSLAPSHYIPCFVAELPFLHPDGEQRVFTIYKAAVPSRIRNVIKFDQDEVAAIEWKSITAINRLLAGKPETLVPSANAI